MLLIIKQKYIINKETKAYVSQQKSLSNENSADNDIIKNK